MKLGRMNKKAKKGLSLAVVTTMVGTQVLVNINTIHALSNNELDNPDTITVNKIGEYKAGEANSDGGVAEIVTYNKENNKMYTINGADKNIHIVDLSSLDKNGSTKLEATKIVDIESEVNKFDKDFKYGDITSIDINNEKKIVVATVQHAEYDKNGKIVVMNYDGDVKEVFECGIQPDMVKVSEDGKYILTADEGEPRLGYGENRVDPEGSVTILNYETKEIKTIKFDDSQLEGKVLIRNKEGGAKVDLEPEYISMSTDQKTAYIALQENNAIATIDIASGKVKSVKSLGFKDHSVEGNELDGAKDSKINIESLPVLGVYMPDGITNINIGGVEYILTANEGDATEWGDFNNISKLSTVDVDKLDIKEDTYGGMSKEAATEKIKQMKEDKDAGYGDLEVLNDVDDNAIYTLGGRSFSIRRADTMEIVFDSGADFENIIAERYPEYFNVTNSNNKMDARSTKKGPEPEYVEVGVVADRIYAFVGIERQGGVMTYDITDPSNSKFINYNNTRDYSGKIVGDSAPEGLKFISAKDNSTKQNLLLVANEVSGTVSINQIGELTDINIFHTNDIHSRAEEVESSGSITNIGYSKFKSFIEEANEDVDGSLLLDAGDALHGQSFATLERGESIAKIMKEVGYDAMAPGNHDFNYGQERLTELGEIGDFEILAGNVKDDQGDLKYGSTMIKEIGDVKVGVFGLATPETAYKTNPNNVSGLDFGTKESIIEDAKEMVEELEKQGADIVVGLAHLGIDADSNVKSTDIAKNVDGIDIIIDGHSHNSIEDYDQINDTIITSAGEHFKNFGMINVTYDKDSDSLIDVNAEMITAKEIQEQEIKDNTKVSSLMKEIKEGQGKVLDTVIGETSITLDGERSSVRYGHTNLGRLLTNAMLYETKADIAITNGGGIRASINKGSITKGNVLDVLPFGNYIVTIEATGQQIIDALNHGLVVGNGSFTHFAGMDVEVKEVKEGGVTRYEVLSVKVAGEEINPNKKYTLATNDFLAVGGDNYTMLKDCTLLNEFSALDEALIDYIEAQGNEAIDKADKENYLTIAKDEIPEDMKPEIIAQDKTINIGDDFDPMLGVSAKDNEDGDITSKIELVKNDVNNQVAGVYDVVYQVTDSANQTTTLTIKVTVVEDQITPEPPVENKKPVITASDVTIKVGDGFNPMAGVTATDEEDGDITSSIKVVKNTVNTSVAGTYEVVYEVSDSNNQTSTKTITVTVEKVTTSGSGTNNPSTGDSGIMGYLAVAGASLGSILFANKRKRK